MSVLDFDAELASPIITLPADMYAKVRGAKAKIIIVTEDKSATSKELNNPLREFGSLKGTFTMRDDFDAPLDDLCKLE